MASILPSLLVTLLVGASSALEAGPIDPITLCTDDDSSWLIVDGMTPYIKLNPKTNFATGYKEHHTPASGVQQTALASVSISIGLQHESTFVVANASMTHLTNGDRSVYPEWGSSHSCQHDGTPTSIDLTGTPFSLRDGKSAFKEYEETIFPTAISPVFDATCDDTNKVCSASCGGWCGGCNAGPKHNVLLSVSDRFKFECGVKAYNSGALFKYVCKGSQCVVSPTGEGISQSECNEVCSKKPGLPPTVV